MRKRRPVLAALAVVVCVFTLVSASCGGGGDNRKPPLELTLWHYYNGTQLVAFDAMIREFNETLGRETGVYIQAVSQGNVNSLTEKVMRSASGGPGTEPLPDIFSAYGDSALYAYNMGLTVNLEDYLSQSDISEYVESFMDEGRFPPNYNYTIFPVAKSSEIFYMDKNAWDELVEAYGRPELTIESLSTWEGITAAAEIYYNHTASEAFSKALGKPFFGLDSAANFIIVSMYQQGVKLVDYKNGELVFNLDKAALKRTFDLYYNSTVKGYFGADGRFRSDDAKTGYLVAYVGATSSSRYFPNIVTLSDTSTRETALITLTMPVFSGAKKAAIQQGAGMVVTKSESAREKAAVEFLKWFTETNRNIQFSVDSSYLPVKKAAYDAVNTEACIKRLGEDEDYSSEYEAKAFSTSIEQLTSCELVYPAVYDGAYELRQYLEGLKDISLKARADVLEDVKNGMPYDTAVKSALNDSAFESFYAGLVELCGK